MPITTVWTSPSRPSSTTWTGRPSLAVEGGLLLINAIDKLLINATDKLIIATASTGTVWTTTR